MRIKVNPNKSQKPKRQFKKDSPSFSVVNRVHDEVETPFILLSRPSARLQPRLQRRARTTLTRQSVRIAMPSTLNPQESTSDSDQAHQTMLNTQGAPMPALLRRT